MKPQKKPKRISLTWIVFIILAVTAAIIAVIFLIGGKTQNIPPLPTEISVTDAAERFADGAFLLDVREPSEWAQGHISGAVLIPLGDLQNRISEIPTDRDVLIICRSGNRSAQARDILRAAGLDRTISIAGGLNQWITAGFPVCNQDTNC